MQIDKLILQKHVFRVLLKSKLWGKKVEILRFVLPLLWQKRPLNACTISLPFSSDGCVVKAVFSRILMKNRKFCTRNLACTIFFFYFRHFQSSLIFDFYIWVLLVDLSTSFFYFFTLNGTLFRRHFFSVFTPPDLFQKTVSEFQKG